MDASILGALAFEELPDPRVEAALSGFESARAFAPALFFFEVRNLLLVNERRGRAPARGVAAFLRLVAKLPITLSSFPDSDALMALARGHRLTVYDAAYLELAVRERLPLATLDRALETAARAEGVDLLGE